MHDFTEFMLLCHSELSIKQSSLLISIRTAMKDRLSHLEISNLVEVAVDEGRDVMIRFRNGNKKALEGIQV